MRWFHLTIIHFPARNEENAILNIVIATVALI